MVAWNSESITTSRSKELWGSRKKEVNKKGPSSALPNFRGSQRGSWESLDFKNVINIHGEKRVTMLFSIRLINSKSMELDKVFATFLPD